MADGTKIEWTDATWNIITGCDVVSPGCTNCYAMRLAGGRLKNHPSRAGLTDPSKAGPVWNGEVRFNDGWLFQPLQWDRPRNIFAVAHGDMFHPRSYFAWLDQIFAVMALCPHHVFQIVTKRAHRMRAYLSRDQNELRQRWYQAARSWEENERVSESMITHLAYVTLPLRNVWLMVSAEDQERAAERVPDLIETPAAVRGVSLEPLLGPIDMPAWIALLDWVIVGGESGPRARPMHPKWARDIRDQCNEAGVAFHFKQWGEWAPSSMLSAIVNNRDWRCIGLDGGSPIGTDPEKIKAMPADEVRDRLRDAAAATVAKIGKKRAGRVLEGRTWDEFPERAS